MEDRPIVGLAVFIVNDNGEFLLGKRKGMVGGETWAPPGGKLDKNESFEDCIIRETKEETSLEISDLTYIATTNDVMKDIDRHYVTLFFSTKMYIGEVMVMEPEKCHEWKWFLPNQLPDNLFLPFQNFLNGNFIS